MVDAIDAMLGIGTDSEEELRALADQLRGKRRSADWLSVTTVPTIRDLAQNRQAEIMSGAEQAGRLRRATMDRDSQDERARLTRALEKQRIDLERRRIRNDEENELSDWAQEYQNQAFDRLMKTREHDLEREKVRTGYSTRGASMRPTHYEDFYPRSGDGSPVKIGINSLGQPVKFGSAVPLSEEEFAEYERAMGPDRLELEMGKIIADEQDAQALAGRFNTLFDLVEPYSTSGSDPRAWKDVPGAGLFSGKSGAVGHVARLAEAEKEKSAAGESIFANLKGLMNMTLREGAGLSQTLTEMENLKVELGDKMFVDPEVALLAYRKMYEAYLGDLKAIQRSSPQVLGAYRSRLGEDESPYFEYSREFPEFVEGDRESLVEYASSVSPKSSIFRRAKKEYPPHWSDKDIADYEASQRD